MSSHFRLLACAAAAFASFFVAGLAPVSAQNFPKADQDQILDHTNFTPARGECFKFLGDRLRRVGGSAHTEYPNLVPRNVCLYAKKHGYRGRIE